MPLIKDIGKKAFQKNVKESIKNYLTSIRDGDIEENEITLLLTDGRNNTQRLKLFIDTLEK